jgi:hypothetical protein
MHRDFRTPSTLIFLMLAQAGILTADTIERRLADLSHDAMSPKRAAYATFKMAQEIEGLGATHFAETLYVDAIDIARSKPNSNERSEVLQQAQKRLASVIEQNIATLFDERKILAVQLTYETAIYATPAARDPTRHNQAKEIVPINSIINSRCNTKSATISWVNLRDVHIVLLTKSTHKREELTAESRYYQELASSYAPSALSTVRRERARLAYVMAMSLDSGRYHALKSALQDFHGEEPELQALMVDRLDDALFYDSNKNGGYEEYLNNYPNGRHAREAQSALETARFEQAQWVSTIESYSNYINVYPNGAHIASARERLEELYFRRAQSANTASEYRGFLGRYPSSKFRQGALSAIEIIDYNNAKSRDSVSSYEEFLSHYPAGQYASLAQTAITRLKAKAAFAEARLANTQGSYEEFLRRFPDAEQANDAWAKVYLGRAVTDQNLASFRSFFDYYDRMSFDTIGQAEWNAARTLLAAIALKRQDFTAFLLLYDRCKAYGALDEAVKLVRTAAQEEEIARREPARFFRTENGGSIDNKRSVAYISFLSHVTMNTDTSVSLPFRSVARYGTYRVKLKLTIRIEFRKETVVLLVGKRVDSETENSSAVAEILLRPNGGNSYATFKFPSFTSHDESGLKILAKVTRDLVSVKTEQYDFESVNLSQ